MSEVPPSKLTPSERMVLIGLAQGKRLTEIARETGRSRKTLSTYKSRMIDKLQIFGTANLVKYAQRHGLVQA